jgi:hypothetical protein
MNPTIIAPDNPPIMETAPKILLSVAVYPKGPVFNVLI